jgi:hypothetical protein
MNRLTRIVLASSFLASCVAACGDGNGGQTGGGTSSGSSSGASSGSGSSGGSGSASGSGSGSSGTGSGSSGIGSGSGSSGSSSDAGASSGGTGSSGDGGTGSSGDGGTGSCSVAQVGINGSFKGYRMFPADHPINTAIDTLMVSSHSADWLSHCSAGHPHLQVDLSMPYQIVAANTPTVTATKLTYHDKPYPNPWPFPASAAIEGGDGHCLAFDVGNCTLYEVYSFAWASGMTTFTGGSGTVWDTTMNDPGNGSGSDAAGLPITPLLIRSDDLVGAGAINHALRFTCASTEQGHIAPARASASSSQGSGVPADPNDPTYPPMGMRVRLKQGYDPTAHGFSPALVALVKAIQKYGLMLADNGSSNSPMYITGATDDALSNALGDQSKIEAITTTDLEVVDTGPVTQD